MAKPSPDFVRQGPILRVFLRDGFVPISNAHVERQIRTVALFHENSLFVASLEAGKRYATLLTVMRGWVVSVG